MQLRGPQCHEQFEIVAEQDFSDINCPECGSTFSLLGSETVDFRQSPSVLGHFELIDRLGAGQFGVVWKARDTQLDRVVAMKVPRRGQLTSEETELFFRDARAAAQLRHPGIVAVHEVGRSDENVFIVTDYIEGADLKEWLTGQRLTSRESAELMALIADAVQHAHAHGVIHRDLKPSNVLMDMHGRPHITDFGLAKRETGEMTMTMDGQVVGTPAYMSPEQAQGKSHHADARSDVYSLGVILYQLLTGELPFRGESRMLIVQIMRDEPPPPRKLNARIPRDLETITLKCLEKAPDKRYQTAEEFGNDLKRFLSNQPVLARPVGRVKRAWRWAGRNPAVAALSVGLFGALVIGLAATSGLWLKAEIARQQATAEAAKATTISDLLQKMLGSANPDEARGADYKVRELLDDFSARLSDELKDQPEFEAAIRATIGNAYRRLGLLDKAEPQLKAALDLRKRVFGQNHAEIAESLYDHAWNLYERRNTEHYIEAEHQVREALVIHRELRLQNGATIEMLGLLQLILTYQTRYQDAEEVAQEALAIARKLPEPCPETANILHRLAETSAQQGNPVKAERLARESVELHRKLHGDNHPETAWGLCDLGWALFDQGKYAEAEKHYREALAIFLKQYDDTNYSVVLTSQRLEATLIAKGDRAGLAKLRAEHPIPGQSTDSGQDEFGVATGTFPVDAARGKHVTYSGWIKTENVDGWAGLWWRAGGPKEEMLAFDNMATTGPRGTNDWAQFIIDLDVPEETTNIIFGVIMPGKGRAWFDCLEVKLDGKEYGDDQFDFDFESQEIKGLERFAMLNYRTELDDQVAKVGEQSLRLESVEWAECAEMNRAVEIDPKLLDQYVGSYKHTADLTFAVTKDKNQLWIQLTGQPKAEVYPKSPTRFFNKVVAAEIEFRKDEAGQVDGLTLFQGGSEIFAAKDRAAEDE